MSYRDDLTDAITFIQNDVDTIVDELITILGNSYESVDQIKADVEQTLQTAKELAKELS